VWQVNRDVTGTTVIVKILIITHQWHLHLKTPPHLLFSFFAGRGKKRSGAYHRVCCVAPSVLFKRIAVGVAPDDNLEQQTKTIPFPSSYYRGEKITYKW